MEQGQSWVMAKRDSPGSILGITRSQSGLALGSLGFAAGTKGRAALRERNKDNRGSCRAGMPRARF